MRECRTYGSVRGVPGDRHPYRDSLEAIRKLNLPIHISYQTIGAPLNGIGVRNHVKGQAGTETVSLRSDGRTVDDSETDASWHTPNAGDAHVKVTCAKS
jgi:hypothetical protein